MVAVDSPSIACLSPHADDAALSCGAFLSRQVARGWAVRVVTVLAGDPPPDEALLPFARELHRRWGGLPAPMAVRRQEDARALALLGCAAEAWPYGDAIYRHPAYDSDERLFGAPADESDLEEELAARCASLPGSLLLFPLGVGHHVDHQLLFRVGWRLHAVRPVAFYEDLPYAAWEGSPAQRLAELGLPLWPRLVETTAHWPAQAAAISCYTSQLPGLERHGVPALAAVARYAQALWPAGYAVRFWDGPARGAGEERLWT